MATCKQCREFEKCKDDAFINGAKFYPNESVKYCTGFEPITNSDRIRAMNDEELAEWIARTQIGAIKDAMNLLRLPYDEPDGLVEMGKTEALEWLKQPAE